MVLKGNEQEKRRVAIYVRVSTTEQKIDGYGQEAQTKRLKDFVQANAAFNWETKPAWFYSDVHTGSDINREGLNALREGVRAKKFDAVLVWKIDRLSRSLKHLITLFEEMEKHGVSFISVQENIDFRGPIGRLIFQIFGAIAQFERELIKGRTQMGRIASAELGNYTGTSIPYGYRDVRRKSGKGKQIEIIPEQRKWVQQIFEWYVYEGFGYGQVATKLNEARVQKDNHLRTKRAGTKWTGVMVKTILTNTVYRGEHLANYKDESGQMLPADKWTIVSVPACISEFMFLQAQRVREGKIGRGPGSDYLLSGKLVDMTLDHPRKFSGAKRHKGGFSYRRKQDTKSGIPVFEVPGKQIEDYVWLKILEALQNPEEFIRRYLSMKYGDPTERERQEVKLGSLRARLITEKMAIARIEAAYEEGQYSEVKMSAKSAERATEIGKIETEIQQSEDQLLLLTSVDVEVKKLRDAAEQVRYRLNKLDPRQKKILCNLFVDRVEMYRTPMKGSGKRQRWRITATVVFRFNPEKLNEAQREGRTTSQLSKATESQPRSENDVIGGR